MTYCREIQLTLDRADVIRASTEKYNGDTARNKYKILAVANRFTKGKKNNLGWFNQRRCSPGFNEEEIVLLNAEAAQEIEDLLKIQNADQTGDDKPFDFNDMANSLRSSYNVISFNKTLFRYVDGIYIEDNGFLDSMITNELLVRGIQEDDKVTTAAQQVKHYLMFGRVENDYPFNLHADAFPVNNGIVKINFDTGMTDLIPFTPIYRFNYKLCVSYDKNADGAPMKEYLDTLGADTDILLQIPAHAILGMFGRVYKKEYFLKGVPESGKSTLLDMYSRRFFGSSVCSAISLQALLNKRFSLAGLDGKILNVYADLGNQQITDIGLFKAIRGGDPFEVERKGKDPYSMTNKALLVFSANKYPKIICGDDAFWKSWISLEFEKSFAMDPTFFEKTFTDVNMSGLLNLVLERMREIIKNGLKLSDNVESKWLNDASSSHRFIRECLEKSKGAVIVKNDLYAQYAIYCDEGDYEVEGHRIFTDAMKLQGALSVRPTIGTVRQHCYQGFKLKGKEPIYPADHVAEEKQKSGGQTELGGVESC